MSSHRLFVWLLGVTREHQAWTGLRTGDSLPVMRMSVFQSISAELTMSPAVQRARQMRQTDLACAACKVDGQGEGLGRGRSRSRNTPRLIPWVTSSRLFICFSCTKLLVMKSMLWALRCRP